MIEEDDMRRAFWIGLFVGVLAWVVIISQRARAAEQRAQLYKQAAIRLEQKLAGS